MEKDFYLTRLIWALALRLEDRLLLKGGTLLWIGHGSPSSNSG